MPVRVTAETIRHSDTIARCRECDWSGDKALDTFHGRLLRSKARRHAETSGHEVMVHVERLSSTYLRPRPPDARQSEKVTP